MGGMIAINVTHRLASFVRGSIISAPALMLDPVLMKLRPIVTCIQSIMPKFVISRLTADSLCHDPVVMEQYCYDILNTPGVKKPVPARTALQLVKGIEDAIACEKDFATPFLLMQGTEDSVCLPKGAETFFDTAVSTDKEFKEWEGSYHEIMNEDNGADVVNYAIDWLNRHMSVCSVCWLSTAAHCLFKQRQEERICPFDCTQNTLRTLFLGKARSDSSSERQKMVIPY